MSTIIANKRHTLAHILAFCAEKKYTDLKLTLGPSIDNGFYYDIDFKKDSRPNTDDDLKSLTKDMTKMVKIGGNFTHEVVTLEKAKEVFNENKYKLELIDEISARGEDITLYTINFKNGETFTDLCRGGHCEEISEINEGSFKLNKIAGAYWRGDEKREQLTRVYGLAFDTKEELIDYENQIEEAKFDRVLEVAPPER